MRPFFSALFLLIVLLALLAGCATSPSQEIIVCNPPQADIYWGRTEADLEKTGFVTPHSRSVPFSKLESWCYQLRKEGYHDSEILCREEEGFRYLDIRLTPKKTVITSEPSGAVIYWGPGKDRLVRTDYRTPRTITIAEGRPFGYGAAWEDCYFQVSVEGYEDSEIIFLKRQPQDRSVHFELIPKAP